MKTTALLLAFFCFFSGRSMAQQADSLAVTRAVDSLIQISRGLTEEGDFDKALEVNAVAEKLALEKLGKETVGYGSVCFNRGRIFDFMENYPESERWYLEANEIGKVAFDNVHPYYALSLNNLGALYDVIGRDSEAEDLLLKSKIVWEKIDNKEYLGYDNTLENLAIFYHSKKCFYTLAEKLFLETKEIRESTVGVQHPKYASVLNNLGILFQDLGRFSDAEILFLGAKEIWRKFPGKESPDYATCINNLATLYLALGNYSKAEPLFTEVIEIRKKTLRTEYSLYAMSLNNLAILYRHMSRYSESESIYINVREIWEKYLDRKHLYYATILNNLAYLYVETGDYSKVEDLYIKSKEIYEENLGKSHPLYAKCLSNLAALYFYQGQIERVEPLLLEAKGVWGMALGKDHSDYVVAIRDLASLYEFQTRYTESEPLLEESLSIQKKLLTKGSTFLSVRELDSYTKIFESYEESLFSNVINRIVRHKTKGHLPSLCYENVLFSKGFLLNTSNRLQLFAFSDSASEWEFEQIQSYYRRLATQYSLPIADRDSALVATLEEKANTLEKELVRTVAGFGDALRQVNWQEVQARLKPGEAAIEFVDFRYSNPDPTDSTLYAALLLRPDWDAPHWVGLCEQRELDALLAAPDPQNNLYTPAQPSILVSDEETPTLYELLWAPLDSLLTGVNTVYYSPSGLLHRLNFDAIPSGRGTLADRYTLHRLNSTRELVIPTEITTPQGPVQAVVYGGIQYGMDSTAIRKALAGTDSAPATTGGGELPFSYADGRARGAYLRSMGEQDTWTYLPGTDREAAEVSALLTSKSVHTTLRKGYAASEESFKQIGRDGHPSPRILHIATHGFFFPDPKDTVDGRRLTADGATAFKISDHPMIRSGLILAGANTAWAGQSVPTGLEDGILTAYEISQMNLRNTELVVLSACETGLGDIQGNEGVYGLQRAFKIAGAKYLLMSLWKVPDAQTRELMALFYREYTGGKAIPEAFRTAQAAMRKRYADRPVLWAGFVLVE